MKQIIISICVIALLSIFGSQKVNAQDRSFQTFFAKFKQNVLGNKKTAVKNMMSSSFEWALDGAVSRDEGWSLLMSQRRYWQDLRKSVQTKPYSCKAIWESYSGYCITTSRMDYDFMFAKVGGSWKFYALRGH